MQCQIIKSVASKFIDKISVCLIYWPCTLQYNKGDYVLADNNCKIFLNFFHEHHTQGEHSTKFNHS